MARPTIRTKKYWKEYRRSYYYANKEKMNAQSRAFGKAHPEKSAAYAKRHRANNPNSTKSSQLKYHFGITLDDYNYILRIQGGVCAICEEPNKYKKNKKVTGLVVDHCHKLNIVRGLLCDRCNLAIGLMRDDGAKLIKAAQYLQRYSKLLSTEMAIQFPR